MSEPVVPMTKVKRSSRLPLLLSLSLFVVVGVVFVIEFVVASQPHDVVVLTADLYMDVVVPLLENADVANGERLVTLGYECHVCHIAGGGQIAPSFVGLGERAGLERSPLQGAAYIYESIVQPSAYIVSDYSGAMPSNYPLRLSDQELGDIIAYLLTQ